MGEEEKEELGPTPWANLFTAIPPCNLGLLWLHQGTTISRDAAGNAVRTSNSEAIIHGENSRTWPERGGGEPSIMVIAAAAAAIIQTIGLGE